MIDLLTAMLASERKFRNPTPTDTRKSFVALRWLLVILASYLTIFSYVQTARFANVFGFAVLFAATNVVFAMLPVRMFESGTIQRLIDFTDIVFVSVTFFLLNEAETYLVLPVVLVLDRKSVV